MWNPGQEGHAKSFAEPVNSRAHTKHGTIRNKASLLSSPANQQTLGWLDNF